MFLGLGKCLQLYTRMSQLRVTLLALSVGELGEKLGLVAVYSDGR